MRCHVYKRVMKMQRILTKLVVLRATLRSRRALDAAILSLYRS